jgi:hypothetical protein
VPKQDLSETFGTFKKGGLKTLKTPKKALSILGHLKPAGLPDLDHPFLSKEDVQKVVLVRTSVAALVVAIGPEYTETLEDDKASHLLGILFDHLVDFSPSWTSPPTTPSCHRRL